MKGVKYTVKGVKYKGALEKDTLWTHRERGEVRRKGYGLLLVSLLTVAVRGTVN